MSTRTHDHVGSAMAQFHTAVAEAADVSIGAVDLHEAQSRTGALPSRIGPLSFETTLAAPAYPVGVLSGDNLWLHRAIEQAPAGSCLVASVDHAQDAGYWGEIMAEASLARGLAGLVIDGQVRDRSRLIDLGFPVFCTGLSIKGTGKNPIGPGSCGQPIVIGDVIVAAGDLVMGDEDGVVVVPASDVGVVTSRALQRKRDEVGIIERLRAGESTMDIYRLPRR